MTANQVAYWRNVETERANRAQEELKSQENAIKADSLTETTRANKASEKIGRLNAGANIANAVTGGLKNVGSAFQSFMSPISDASKMMASAGLLGLI